MVYRRFLESVSDLPTIGHGGEKPGVYDFLSTPLPLAMKFADDSLRSFGRALDIEVPNFPDTFSLAKDAVRMGWATRREMPVFTNEQVAAFADLARSGNLDPEMGPVRVEWLTLPVHRVKPSQKQIYFDIAFGPAASRGKSFFRKFLLDNVSIISKDGYLVDGHHRWLGAMLLDPDMPMRCCKVGLPIDVLLPLAKNFSDNVGNPKNEMFGTSEAALLDDVRVPRDPEEVKKKFLARLAARKAAEARGHLSGTRFLVDPRGVAKRVSIPITKPRRMIGFVPAKGGSAVPRRPAGFIPPEGGDAPPRNRIGFLDHVERAILRILDGRDVGNVIDGLVEAGTEKRLRRVRGGRKNSRKTHF